MDLDVYDFEGKAAMPEDEREACAMGLSASITDEGWIVLSGSPEIELGGHEPELEFGGLGRKQPFVLFFPGAVRARIRSERGTAVDRRSADLDDEEVRVLVSYRLMMRSHVYCTGGPKAHQQRRPGPMSVLFL